MAHYECLRELGEFESYTRRVKAPLTHEGFISFWHTSRSDVELVAGVVRALGSPRLFISSGLQLPGIHTHYEKPALEVPFNTAYINPDTGEGVLHISGVVEPIHSLNQQQAEILAWTIDKALASVEICDRKIYSE